MAVRRRLALFCAAISAFAATAGGLVGGTALAATPSSTPASSPYPPAEPCNLVLDNRVTLNRITVHPGQQFTLHGTGYGASRDVTIEFHSTPRVLGVAHTDAAGAFTFALTIPADAQSGPHEIVVNPDMFTCHVPVAVVADAPPTVTASTLPAPVGPSSHSTGGLAFTGVRVAGLGAVGVVLILGGIGAAIAGRRRSHG